MPRTSVKLISTEADSQDSVKLQLNTFDFQLFHKFVSTDLVNSQLICATVLAYTNSDAINSCMKLTEAVFKVHPTGAYLGIPNSEFHSRKRSVF